MRENNFKNQNVSNEQMQLNKLLLKACLQKKVDLLEIESLLKAGAETFDITDEKPIFCKIIEKRWCDDEDDLTIYNLAKIFVDYGMNINIERRSEDDEKYIDFFWQNPFICMKFTNLKSTIKLIELFIANSKDIFNLIDEYIDEIWCWMIACSISKMSDYILILLYLLSYPYFYELCYYLVRKDKNDYNAKNFRNIDNYYCDVDFSTRYYQDLDNSGTTIKVFDKVTKEMVWSFVLCGDD